MGGGAHIDDDELRTLELDISQAPGRLQRNAAGTLRDAGKIWNAAMRVDAAGHQGNWFGIPGTEFDTPLEKHVSHELLSPWVMEAGIESKGAGKLAHIIVFGSVNNAPVYDHMSGPRRSMPAVMKLFGDLAEDSVLGKGGGGRAGRR